MELEQSPLGRLPSVAVCTVFRFLDAASLCAAAQTCRLWSECGEREYGRRSRARGWRLPRRPRGAFAASRTPWRTLHLSHSCLECRRMGEYRVLGGRTNSECGPRHDGPGLTPAAGQYGMVCKACATGSASLMAHLVERRLGIESVSIVGEPLSPSLPRR